jgi:hypothetical protein
MKAILNDHHDELGRGWIDVQAWNFDFEKKPKHVARAIPIYTCIG